MSKRLTTQQIAPIVGLSSRRVRELAIRHGIGKRLVASDGRCMGMDFSAADIVRLRAVKSANRGWPKGKKRSVSA